MRGANVLAVGLATVCGIATAYSAFQPAFEEQKEKRDPTFVAQHKEPENKISQAIASDFKEAGEEIRRTGFAWGIRQALFGTPPPRRSTTQSDTTGAAAHPQEEKPLAK